VYKYVGDFEYLKQLGFVQDKFKNYWFLPTKSVNRFINPISVNIKNRIVEYTTIEQLNIIKKYIQSV
jgi:hypothetical protein